MSVSRFSFPFFQSFQSSTGNVGAGWQLHFWQTGTTDTRQTTYSDSTLTTANPNPVVADGNGRWSDIFLQDALYAVELTDETGAQIAFADPVGNSVVTSIVGKETEVITVSTDGQTSLTLTGMSYTPGSNMLLAFLNGACLDFGVDIEEATSTTFNWISGEPLTAGDRVKIIKNQQVTSSAPLAANTSYVPVGTNARSHSVQEKLREIGPSLADYSGTDTERVEAAIVAQGGKQIIISEDITISAIDIDRNVHFHCVNNPTITLSGVGAGFRVVSDFDYFKITGSGVTFKGDGLLASLHKCIYADSSARAVQVGVFNNVTCEDVVVGLETTPYQYCVINEPRILKTVGTGSGQGYGIVGAGSSKLLYITNPYLYRTTRHGIYAGNVEHVQIINPIFEEHAFGETGYNFRSALAISRDDNCHVVNPMFLNCAEEGIGIDDDNTASSGEAENIKIVGGSTKNPQGAFRALRIGTTGTPSSDNMQRMVDVRGFSIDANTSLVNDVEFYYGKTIHLDLFINGDKSYSSGKSFVGLNGSVSGGTEDIHVILRGSASGTASLIPVAIGTPLCISSAEILIESYMSNISFPVNYSVTPTNTKISIIMADSTSEVAYRVAKAVSSVGEATISVEGGANGYGCGYSFTSRTTINGAPSLMGQIVADGEAAWDGVTANMDASISVSCVENDALTKVVKFRTPTSGRDTGLFLYDATSGTLQQVSLGANNSGDAGFSVLQVPNP